MIGAIIGDVVGSRFEFNNYKGKKFPLFTSDCFITDDSVMTVAVCDAFNKTYPEHKYLGLQTIKSMREIGRRYPHCGYGGGFARWMFSETTSPYNSYGNGAAMRVSACGWVGKTLDEVKNLSAQVTCVTHNHPEGLKGAEATAVAIWLARKGYAKDDIRQYVEDNYYDLNFTLDQIRPKYRFNETCQETVPQAIAAFLESNDFEDAIRNAISLGGDSDTLAAITGSIAEAFYGVPDWIKDSVMRFLTPELKKILEEFNQTFNV